MRLWILSDLHRDVGPAWAPATIPQADVAVIAGDIGEGLVDSIAWAGETIRPHMPVLMVAGNHEFYRSELPAELARGRAAAAERGIHLLENDSVVIGRVGITGCTLWTDYALDGAVLRPLAMESARRGMNDHRRIAWATKPQWRRFRPEEAAALHAASRAYLREVLLGDLRVADDLVSRVVITHHAPSRRSVTPQFAKSALNPAYASDLEPLIEAAAPTLWVHGHMHASVDYRIGGTRVVCNPKGYGTENNKFDPALVVEVAS
ncbi:metallophosphoesterase [Microvirga thermotolerans]|uniref:Metallophosphoesterase n=1 Tax=Microvirga thermotolerans TaxID=2651334 RepID=A0A5P9JRR4_9HYPH|nr:metallophosphoesterase [Microvirga thermotolerans]QFU14759.1 metallophosphoesterase [Microvirga thermotolerans]